MFNLYLALINIIHVRVQMLRKIIQKKSIRNNLTQHVIVDCHPLNKSTRGNNHEGHPFELDEDVQPPKMPKYSSQKHEEYV
jgi:hypothetical protein